MKEKHYTDYDNECMIYLAIQIHQMIIRDKFIYIDEYYKLIKSIYKDYKKYDNNNVSLLESINDYINEHKEEIIYKLQERVFDL